MLDEISQKVVKELHTDARQSFREIGRRLGISEGTVRNRVQRLLKENILRMEAVPNPQQLGFNFICVVGIETKVGTAERVEHVLIKSPNVYFLCGCTGDFDIIGIFIFRTPYEFDDFVKNVIGKIKDIARTRTFVAMHISKSPWGDMLDLPTLLNS
ncbi:Lrp/AsnC family transcriptional regulator [Chloroflexota bacterium]